MQKSLVSSKQSDRAHTESSARATGNRPRSRTLYHSNRLRGAILLALAAAACVLGGTILLQQSDPSINVDRETLAPSSTDNPTAAPSTATETSLPLYVQDGLSKNDWRLTLVNATSPIDPAYEALLAVSRDGRLVDERCLDEYERMLNDCREAGLSPFVSSAYRTREYQELLYENQVQLKLGEGYTLQEARERAATVVAAPETSEHQLGLAFDIVDEHNPSLVDEQAETPTQQWLLQHSWEYGFVLRYPPEKSTLTQVIFEPWHYRYVGAQAARTIFEKGLCLEEYLEE